MDNPIPDELCQELKTILRSELRKGNRILVVEKGWSKVTLAVRLTGPLDLEYIKNAAAKNPDLQIWQSNEVKNPQETGVLCKSAAQTLSGSLSKKT
jgi:hypothetical protein